MSQTPLQLRRVPVHILDELSSKFLINLVSREWNLFLFIFFTNFSLSCSLRRRKLISLDYSSKSNLLTGSFWISTALKKRIQFTRVESSNSLFTSSSTFHFFNTTSQTSRPSLRNGKAIRCLSQPTEPSSSRLT